LPPDLQFIKRLVTVLTATMIAGLLTIVALLVIRLAAPAPLPALPEAITLPPGAEIAALTFAQGLVVVVTTAGEVLLFAPDGTLRQSLRP